MHVGGNGLSPVMVGRGAELARLRGMIGTGPDPAVALVGGEAGVGKSRLVRELIAGLAPTVPVLVGQTDPAAPGRPFQVLLDAVEAEVAAWTMFPAGLEAREDPVRLLLAPVAPGMSSCVEREYGQEELVRAAIDIVRHLAAPGGVVVFEDLHAADPDSISLFVRMATTPGLDLLLIGTYRAEELGGRRRSAELLAAMERRRPVTHIALRRLDEGDVGDLLRAVYGRPAPYRAVDALYRRTGGNPFFLEELVLSAGRTDPEELAALPLPWSLTEIVLRALDDLEPAERRVVDAAAVLGQRIHFDLLAAVTGCGEDDLIRILRRVVAAGLLVEDEPDVFSFRHALTREAIGSQLLGRERRRLHEKALMALLEEGSTDHGAVAHHAMGAGRYDEMVAAARQGAEAYLRRGSASQALRLAEMGLSEAEDDISLLTLASRTAWLLGLLQSALRYGERWRALAAAAGDWRSESRALCHLSRVHLDAGDRPGQRASAEAALALAQDKAPSVERAEALTLVAEVHVMAGADQLAEAVVWADRALEVCDAVGCRDVRARALVNKGSSLIEMPGHFDEGSALLEQAWQEARAAGDSFNQCRAIHNLLCHTVYIWPLERSYAAVAEARDAVERSGRRGNMASLWAGLAVGLAELEGDLAEAQALLAESLRSDPSATEGRDRHFYAACDAWLVFEAGDFDGVASRYESHSPALDATDCDALWLEAVAAGAAARNGDLRRCAVLFDEALARLTPTNGDYGAAFRIALGDAVLAGFPVDEAMAVAARLPAAVTAASGGDPLSEAQLRAAMAEAQGRHEDALADWLAAMAPEDYHRRRALVGWSALGAARCLLALGRPAEARPHAERAVTDLARWPGWRQAEALALQRRLQGASASLDSPLTAREQEVAILLAAGLSNGEVAKRLYISTKTASVHVSNILAKLGLTNRAEIAAWAVRSGLAG